MTQIIAVLDEATAFCSCGFHSAPQTGDRRTAKAKQALLLHLESAYNDKEYHIKLDSNLICPLCKSDLDLSKEDKGLLRSDQPSVVQCEDGHAFDAYVKGNTLFLFVNDSEDGPFATY